MSIPPSPVKNGRTTYALAPRDEVVYLLDPPDVGSRIVLLDANGRFEVCLVQPSDDESQLLRRRLVRGVEGTGPKAWPAGTEWTQTGTNAHENALSMILKAAECLASEGARAGGTPPSVMRMATALQEAGLLRDSR